MGGTWLYWIGGAIVGIGGLLLAFWGLFADRSRGRKRCPKCWYSMEGIAGDPPYRCPECGKVIKTRRKLHKTRRRLVRAVIGSIGMVGALIVIRIPRIIEHGPVVLVPLTALILAAGVSDNQWVWDTLEGRVTGRRTPSNWASPTPDKDEFSGWQWKLLAWSCARSLGEGHDADRQREALDLLKEVPPHSECAFDEVIEHLGPKGRFQVIAASVLHNFAVDDRLTVDQRATAIDKLIALMKHDPQSGGCSALAALESLSPESRSAIPILHDLLNEDLRLLRGCVITALVALDPDRERMIEALLRELDRPTVGEHFWAIHGMVRIMQDDSRCIEKLSLIVNEAEGLDRLWATQALAMKQANPTAVVPVLVEFASGGDAFERRMAVKALAYYVDHPEACIPTLIAALADEDPMITDAAAEGLGKFGTDAIAAKEALLEIATGDDWRRQHSALEALKKIRPETDESDDSGG